jgi:hypothetical protein
MTKSYRNIFSMIFFIITMHGWAQNNQPGGSLYQIYQEKQAYFDVLRSQLPESEFLQEGGEYAEFQKWFRYWQVRSPQGEPGIYDLMMKSYCDQKFYSGGSFKSNTDPWLEIGPKRISNNMFGIGPIRHISISKDDSDHMLCTSNSGGLFYTSDANTSCTWYNAGTDIGLPHSGCNWADFYPGSTAKWYTTSTYETISSVGGLYRTENNGADWERIADHTDLGGPTTEVFQFLFDRKLNGQSDHRLFLMTSNGCYVTDEPEATDPLWSEMTVAIPNSVSSYSSYPVDPNVLVYDMEYLASSTSTSTLCASMRFTILNGSQQTKIWRFMLSTDDGATWSEAPDQPAIDPAWEWATVETSAATETAFHCMVEKGNSSWVKLFDVNSTIPWPTLASSFNPGFGSGHTFGVDQFNANSLFVGDGVDVNWYLNGAEIPFTYPAAQYSPPTLTPINQQFINASTGHDDVEDVVGDPVNPGIFWIANHGGVSRININVSPRTWEYKCEGLGIAEVWSMSTSQNRPDYIALGLFHDCHLLTRTPYAPAWDPDWSYLNQYGDGTLAIVDPSDANIIYHATQGGPWERKDNAETSNISTTDWFVNQSQYHAEGALNRKKPAHLYYAAKLNFELEIARSFNRGTNYEIVSDFTNNLEVNHPVFDNAEQFWWIRSNPANPDHLYVSLQNYDWQQRIFRNTDIDNPNVQGVRNSWQDLPHPRRAPLGSSDPDREPGVADVAFDTEDANTIYLVYHYSSFLDPLEYSGQYANKMVYRMDVSDLGVYPGNQKFDCGGSYPCTDITMNLPNTIVDKDCLEFEQGSDGGLYIATEVGVYFTNNKRIAAFDPLNPEDADIMTNTSGWVRLGGALPHVTSIGLEVNYQINRIRIGTTGRGVWEHGLHCPPYVDLVESGTYVTDEFKEAQASITSDAIVPPAQRVNYRGGSEVHLTPGFHAEAGSHFHGFIHPCDQPGNSLHPKNLAAGDFAVEEDDLDTRFSDHSMTLFPNPAQESLSVLCPGLPANAVAQLRLIDATGRVVLTTNMNGPLNVLDVSNLQGFFTVVVDDGEIRIAGRAIIQ